MINVNYVSGELPQLGDIIELNKYSFFFNIKRPGIVDNRAKVFDIVENKNKRLISIKPGTRCIWSPIHFNLISRGKVYCQLLSEI